MTGKRTQRERLVDVVLIVLLLAVILICIVSCFGRTIARNLGHDCPVIYGQPSVAARGLQNNNDDAAKAAVSDAKNANFAK